MRLENVNQTLEESGLDPAEHFIDHAGRKSPLVVRHKDGRPVYTVEDDGSLAYYHQEPDPNAPAVKIGGRS